MRIENLQRSGKVILSIAVAGVNALHDSRELNTSRVEITAPNEAISGTGIVGGYEIMLATGLGQHSLL